MTDSGPRSLTPFIIRLGLVSLFADFTYEGSHAILGSFLATLKAGPLLVGLVAGGGELLGSGIRLLAGAYTDRTRRYWPVMAWGYALNMIAVPALAFAQGVGLAVTLIWGERLGKGIRTPARNTVLADAAQGRAGHAFGLHAALDQVGGLLGPLLVALMVHESGYRLAFAALAVPALLSLLFFYRAYRAAPPPQAHPVVSLTWRFPKAYYGYLAFAALTVMGFAHFILFSYHLSVRHRLPPPWIPVLYAVGMAAAGITAFPAGHLFDRIGLKTLSLVPILLIIATPLQFLGPSPASLVTGTLLWGAALGVQDGALRAGLAPLIPAGRRASAYGLFDAGFGLAWMLGSLIMGGLYTLGSDALVLFAEAAEILALVLLTGLVRTLRRL